MKILTVGLSPYIFLSHSRIHSMIIKNLYFSHHEVACVGIGHDTTYFLPKMDKEGKPKCYYSFDGHDIPLVPLDINKNPSVGLYEIIKILQPEVVLTIGDYNDFWYMKAVKMFSEVSIKWVSILVNYDYPINEKNTEMIDDIDGILCTNNKTYDMMKLLFKKDEISLSHIGCPPLSDLIEKRESLRSSRNLDGKFRIMSCSKNLQSDNIPMLIEIMANLRKELPDLELYLHTNVHDKGDYDLQLIQERFDPNGEFIVFPDKYVSLMDGFSEKEYQEELVSSDLFVSVSLNSSSALSVFESIACGCPPLMTDAGCYQDVSSMLSDVCLNFQRNDFLIPSIEVMTRGEVYVNICRPDALKNSILGMYGKIKKEGYKKNLQQFITSHSHKSFLDDVLNLIETVKNSAPTICVENCLEEIKKNGHY